MCATLTGLIVAVAGPTFPTEILAKIVKLVAETCQFDFAQEEWSAGIDIGALRSLCSTSKVFNELGSAALYSHLVLPTPESGQALLRTLQSARWRDGARKGMAVEWIKAVTLGSPAAPGRQVNGDFAVSVLRDLSRLELRRVAIVGLEVDATSVFIKLESVRFLQLRDAVLEFTPNGRCALPLLSHLHLSDFHATSMQWGHAFFQELSLARLTHFCTRLTAKCVSGWPAYWNVGLEHVAPQLETIIVREEVSKVGFSVKHDARRLHRLKQLVWDVDCTHVLPSERLAAPLTTLELVIRSEAAIEGMRGLLRSLQQDLTSVRSLKILRLSRPEIVRSPAGPHDASRVALYQDVVSLAEARGVQVEWV